MYSLLSYAGILVVATFAAIVLIFAPLFLLATLLAPFRVPRSPRRVIGTVYGVSVIFGPFIAYLALSYFHVYPPRLFEKPQVITQKKVDAVDQMGQDLIAAFSQPERLTIQQLRDSIEKVRDYTAQATAVNRTQETQIAQLRQTAEEETKKAKEAEGSARSVRSLTSQQLDAVKFLITKDASQQSKQYFIFGAIASFPIGVLSALLAAAFWERLGRKNARIIERRSGFPAPHHGQRPCGTRQRFAR